MNNGHKKPLRLFGRQPQPPNGALQEHPKPQVELLKDSKTIIEGYAAQAGLTFIEAAAVLTFNEARCIHWHADVIMAQQKEAQTKEISNEH